MNLNHFWSYHQHIPDGFHGNVRTEIQTFKCRMCGVVKQMPAHLDQKPPLEGCTVEKLIVAPIPVRNENDYLEEKGDDYGTGKGVFRKSKTSRQ
jgi:hypothetical protein